MNFLIISQFFMSDSENLAAEEVVATIEETYVVGSFDAIIFLSDGNRRRRGEKLFPFAEVYEKTAPKEVSFAAYVAFMESVIDQFRGEISKKPFFMVLHSRDDDFPERVTAKLRQHGDVCFMSFNDYADDGEDDFVEIELDDELRNECDTFMESFEKYLAGK
ncbi:MAG: hypothetical protein LBB18_03555 [Puniceicoccales bacterium]|nr:hypothetical protein [Puniceicoccales bacterium]